MQVKFHNQQYALLNNTIQLKQKAPDAILMDTEFNQIDLRKFYEKPTIICSLNSIDEANNIVLIRQLYNEFIDRDDLNLIIITPDLPFNQFRFLINMNMCPLMLISDYKNYNFAKNFGLLITPINLLNKGLIVIKNGVVEYLEILDDLNKNLNLDQLKKITETI